MPSLDEGADVASPLDAALKQGERAISEQQEVCFTLYVRVALPLDGYVFWVKSDLVSKSTLFNVMGFNEVPLNTPQTLAAPASTFTQRGSLHYASRRDQREDQNFSVNRMVFTSEGPIEKLNQVGPNQLWIGRYKDLTFAFGSHGLLYRAAGLWHYEGDAVYPDTAIQLVDELSDLQTKQIVSNSLPLWLKMNYYTPAFYEAFGNDIPLYPAFLVPANLTPPWGSVFISPETTEALASAPSFDSQMNRWQICKETVRITLFGLNNDAALDFADFVQQWAENNPDDFGIMNMPVIKDLHRVQTELGVIVQKKEIVFEINYFQQRMNQIARALIEECIPEFFPSGAGPIPPIVEQPSLDFSDPDNSGYLAVFAGV